GVAGGPSSASKSSWSMPDMAVACNPHHRPAAPRPRTRTRGLPPHPPPHPAACAPTPDEDPRSAPPAPPPTRPTRRFPTDLTDAQWCLLAPLLPTPRSGPGRPGRPATSRRALVDAILYVLWTGCPWRAMPDGYPHWRTVHHHFA